MTRRPLSAGATALQTIVRAEAAKYGVSGTVHPDDFIFKFCIGNPVFDSAEAAIAYYFSQAEESARRLKFLIELFYDADVAQVELLEFASGYGAVTRHLVKLMAPTAITSCDIHEAAVAFLRSEFHVSAIQSVPVPEDLQFGRQFDVVFALSFFSHMPKRTWGRWLRALTAAVKPGGLAILTTHGEVSGRRHLSNPELDADGFWFSPNSEQEDLDVSEYGLTVTAKRYVDLQLDGLPSVALKQYKAGYWWSHQDLYVLERPD